MARKKKQKAAFLSIQPFYTTGHSVTSFTSDQRQTTGFKIKIVEAEPIIGDQIISLKYDKILAAGEIAAVDLYHLLGSSSYEFIPFDLTMRLNRKIEQPKLLRNKMAKRKMREWFTIIDDDMSKLEELATYVQNTKRLTNADKDMIRRVVTNLNTKLYSEEFLGQIEQYFRGVIDE